MHRMAGDRHLQIEDAETTGPDTRCGRTVEIEDMAFQHALFGEITDARIKPAFLIGAQEQHRIVGKRHTAFLRRAQRQQRGSDRAFHVSGAETIEIVALDCQRERIARPSGRDRNRIDMIIKTTDRLAALACRNQVRTLAGCRTTGNMPEVARYRHTLKIKAERRQQFAHQIGKWPIAFAWRKGRIDRNHA
ncbi:hypothetical protein D3C71_616760 [compost metagenome]